MEILISYDANVDSQNKAGQSPLHTAVAESNLLCAQVLVKHGASTNLMDANGQTALMLAQGMDPRNEELVTFLVEQQRCEAVDCTTCRRI
jgi:ankyrin repeat protein